MSDFTPRISIPVDLSNPGQFFACCGLLEVANRIWPGAEGWFEGDHYHVAGSDECSLLALLDVLANATITSTLTPQQKDRLEKLSAKSKKIRVTAPGSEIEKRELDARRRSSPVILGGSISFQIDWFCAEFAGGSRLKTWAGQQSAVEIATAMQMGVKTMGICESLWRNVNGVGLPFYFDSDLGGQGSARDIGFSFDPLSYDEATRIETSGKPVLELLAFIGLQRFRPQELKGHNRFVYAVWSQPFAPVVAAACACRSIAWKSESAFEFRLLYRTKYLKGFLPSIPYRGDGHE